MPEIDHEYTQGEIVCPYCGNKQDDIDFRIDNYMEGKEICENCDKEFKFESDISIYWITSKIDNKSLEPTASYRADT